MKFPFILIITSIILLTSSEGKCADKKDSSQINVVMGVGSGDCLDFTKAIKLDSSLGIGSYYSWAVGMESGLNMAAMSGSGTTYNLNPTDFDPNQQIAFLENYCNNHPKDGFDSASISLMQEILKHQHSE